METRKRSTGALGRDERIFCAVFDIFVKIPLNRLVNKTRKLTQKHEKWAHQKKINESINQSIMFCARFDSCVKIPFNRFVNQTRKQIENTRNRPIKEINESVNQSVN